MFGTLLFRWRFVIHGAIDGFSRMIVFLRCSTNNRASTVFDAFQSAVEKFGLPSRVRSDKGKENTDVAPITRAGSWKPHYRTKCPQPENREVMEGHVLWVYICFLPFVLLYGSMRSSRHHKRASFGCTPLCVLTPY